MKKNLIIAALIIWNLILMAVLIVVWIRLRPAQILVTQNAPTAPEANSAAGEQNFTYKTGDRMVGDKAPPIADRNIALTVTFDTQDKGGVIVAHGGLAQGYALYVEDGQLFFVTRRNNALTTVDGGKLTAGRHTLKATFSKTGALAVSLDNQSPATGNAGGGIAAEPIDGFDVGGDRGAAVGPYAVPNDFGGIIESVSLKTTP